MRECIYCGRQLEKGEKCSCAMSVAKRMEKDGNASNSAPKKEKKQKKERKKRERTYTHSQAKSDTKNAFKDVWRQFVSFIKNPVETVMNPGEMSWATILILVAIEGIICGLCVFSVYTGVIRGAVSILGNAMGFRGLAGYTNLKNWLLAGFSGGLSGIVMFFLYSGIFFAVNKWIVRQFSPYREFIKRFAFVALPISVLGAFSVVLGLFSKTTLLLLLICGVIGSVIITYEILRSVWYKKSPTQIMYIMMACIFIFLLIAVNFIRIA